MEIGQLCVKTAGRDSGQFCVVVENVDDVYVLIEGNVRRKKCNIKHLEAVDKVLKVKEKASNSEVTKALEKEGIKSLKKGEKRTKKEKSKKVRKVSKKEPKKESKKEESKKEKDSKEKKK
ncbi:MAG: 50S ribosomal protein L14e [Nanoarchaeota archaeon]|nr:50S ribosomal protein L14e [Nanoarchaeota archaeon]|tara:strand:- start:2498 stop:2857 length:360 start_codon:yes stop_codon:yes gene_type:complete